MLFPSPMIRLIWFIPKVRLAAGLELLTQTGRFHLAEHCRLGAVKNLDDLKAVYQARIRGERRLHMLGMLSRFPPQTLLHYQVGELPAGAALPDGACSTADGTFLWVGPDSPPEDVRGHLYSTAEQELPALPVQLSEAQWRLLFASEASVGHVGSWAVVCGWFPASALQLFRQLLAQEAVFMTAAEDSGLAFEEVPVAFKRPAWLQGFGALMRAFGLTGYRELDPTVFLAAGFVLLFGMMFADFGQGLVLALAGYLLLHGVHPVWMDNEAAHGTGSILLPAGLAAAAFGLLFGSCFAREDLIPALWFHPADHMLFYLGATVVAGMCMIVLGLLLRLVNAVRMGHFRADIFDKFGLMGLLFYTGFIMVAFAMWQQTGISMHYGSALSAMALFAVVVHKIVRAQDGVSMGVFLGLLEGYDMLTRYLAQTVSFSRIAAFTLAHIGLSTTTVIISEVADSAWLSVVCMIAGNIIIIVLEGLLVSIQVLRLHFYEFFSKFVAADGQPFRPMHT